MTRFEWLKRQIEFLREYPRPGCIEWPFAHIPKGYGQVWDGNEKKQWLVHRIAYQLFNGQAPQYLVCHHCDNPPCFNPLHLYDGTPEDNAADMVRRHRDNGGDKKLSETHVQEIIDLLKNSDMSLVEIGDRFSITHPTVSAINTGKAWRHIPRPIPIRRYRITRPGKSTILTEQDGKGIGRLLSDGITQDEIASRFGVSQTCISAIKRGKIKAFRQIVQPSLHDDRYKLEERDAIKIIELLKDGIGPTKIAQRFGVGEKTIRAIKGGEIWKYLPRPQKWPPNKSRILIESQVVEIINLLHRGIKRSTIAEQFGVSIWAIKDIKSGRRWGHIPRPWVK